MREILIKTYEIDEDKLNKFRLRITNLLEALYSEIETEKKEDKEGSEN